MVPGARFPHDLGCGQIYALTRLPAGAPIVSLRHNVRAMTGHRTLEALVDNLNVDSMAEIPSPQEVRQRLPITERAAETVLAGRKAVRSILERQDPRLFVVVGPCSVHDPDAALDYAGRLRRLADEVRDTLVLVMRVYFEKPRTSVGWKGFINDPAMDDSFRIDEGLLRARKLLMQLAELGLPTGSEALDPICPQYLAELITWYAIGARTTESQTHREMASGLSAPVGFKNGTDGALDVAVNAIRSAARPHGFLGVNQAGRTSIIRSKGNAYGHLVLRGGGGRPNYDTVSVRLAEQALAKAKLSHNIVIDCSHANAMKDHSLQALVFNDCVHQIIEGNRSIVGFMLESNLEAGSQPIPEDRSQLRYGVSVTDPCIDWRTTEDLLRRAHGTLRPLLAQRGNRVTTRP
jgi:3-deoxy-7-phosphoheptulonate synthase